MFLLTQSDLTLNSSAIPVGAYSMFVIPDDTQWTLTVNKNVKEGSAYDPTQDLVHAPIQIGHLSSKDENVKIVFGHVANKQCNLRIYRGETGAWAEFKEM